MLNILSLTSMIMNYLVCICPSLAGNEISGSSVLLYVLSSYAFSSFLEFIKTAIYSLVEEMQLCVSVWYNYNVPLYAYILFGMVLKHELCISCNYWRQYLFIYFYDCSQN